MMFSTSEIIWKIEEKQELGVQSPNVGGTFKDIWWKQVNEAKMSLYLLPTEP